MPNDKTIFPQQQHFVLAASTAEHFNEFANLTVEQKPLTVWRQAWLILRRRVLFWLALAVILLVFWLALMPTWFTSNDPMYCDLSYSLAPSSSQHWFGFDRQGCDIFARVIYGARSSMLVGLLSAVLVFIIGGFLGAVAGYYGGVIDTLISRITDIFFAVPLVLAAIVTMQMFKENRSVLLVVLILASFGWPQIARITRSSVMSVKNLDFVKAARVLGLAEFKILFLHVLPNAIAPTIVYTTVALGTFIVTEATLSFLGIGLPAGLISWGADIAQAQYSLRQNPLVLLYPSLFLAVTVLGFIMLGDVIRDALNPKGNQ